MKIYSKMGNITGLHQLEISFVTGGDLFSGVGGYLGLVGGITVGTLATNYCARTKSGILSKVVVMLAFAFGGAWIGKGIEESRKVL